MTGTEAGLPSGELTVLFTDIEGSTALLRDLGNLYPAILADHFRHLRAAVSGHGGVEVKTEGDALFAVFRDASDAIRACVQAQTALATQRVAGGHAVRVRMGLHSGKLEVHDGEYVGLAVNQAARIVAAANGGQVLCSSATAAQVVSPVQGIDLQDLGAYSIRSFDEPERLFQVRAGGLEPANRPPRVLPATAHNVPVIRTSFLGRSREFEELEGLLRSHRLVTVLGPGGTGKTRLSFELLRRVSEGFEDGAVVVLLASITGEFLIPTIAETMGIREEVGLPLEQTLVSALERRNCLLLLDNCEHVVDEVAAFLDTVIERAPRVTLLTTSRRPLEVFGERLYPLGPLEVPNADASSIDIATTPAVMLFMERAIAANPDVAVDPAAMDSAARICRHLDGLPLALELAAARARSLPITSLERGVRDTVEMLGSGPRTAVTRQRTVLGLVEWSYRLLDADEQVAFQRISVFRGGFSFEAFEGVCLGPPLDARVATRVVSSLADHSLVTLGPDGRYRVLVVVRDVAGHFLAAADDADAVRDMHLDWYGRMADQQAAERFQRVRPLERATTMEAESDNLRAALDWAIHRGRWAEATRMALELAHHAESRGLRSEAREIVSRVRRHDIPDALLVELLVAECRTTDSAPAALETADRALDIATRSGDQEALYHVYTGLAAAATRAGDNRPALQHAEAAIAVAAALGPGCHAAALRLKAGALYRLNEIPAARESLHRGLELALANDCPEVEASLRGLVGLIAAEEGDLSLAADELETALTFFQRLGNLPEVASQLTNLGMVDFFRGHYDESGAKYQESRLQAIRCGDRETEATTLCNLAEVALVTGRLEEADELCALALTIARQLKLLMVQCYALGYHGTVARCTGDLDTAEARLLEAAAVAAETGAPTVEAAITEQRAAVAAARGDWSSAQELAERSLAIAPSRGSLAHALLAQAHARAGTRDKVREHAIAAMELVAETRTPEVETLAEVAFAVEGNVGRALGAVVARVSRQYGVTLPPPLVARMTRYRPTADPAEDGSQSTVTDPDPWRAVKDLADRVRSGTD